MTQRFEHCRLSGTRVEYLGRIGLFEDRGDKTGSNARAWDWLEKEGWELVAVAPDKKGEHVYYLKRPFLP